jgi:beta-galactosidase/beta-glucuronidase
MKRANLISLLILAGPGLFATTRIDMNTDWRFRTDPSGQGQQQSWTDHVPGGTREVRLPHTWNMGSDTDFQGDGWYFKTFPAGGELIGKHVELHFGATFYHSSVWLNGILLGSHEGGFTAYYFDISPYLRKTNILSVKINNQPTTETIPGIPLKMEGPNTKIYDWWPYGGIVRDTWLTVAEDIHIRWQHLDSQVSGVSAIVSNNIMIENTSSRTRRVLVRSTVYSADQEDPVASAEQIVKVSAGKQEVHLSFQIPKVRVWDFDNPYLYRVVSRLEDDKRDLLDFDSDRFGIRAVKVWDRHLFLNGNRVRLSGLARHEDSPWEGLAETAGTILHDFDDLKTLQTTLTRPVHYPQNPLIYDYCDEKGILVIPEIPLWQFDESQLKNPKVFALAKQMLREMIEQNYNHPSIFAWSMGNESSTETPGGIAYIRSLYKESKNLNPDRYVTFADDRIAFVQDPTTNASSIVDFIMWNEYFGSWDGAESLLVPALERVGKEYPEKMVIISEFGAPGMYATDEKSADVLRVHIIQDQMRLFAKYDWIGGAIQWSYQDYHSYDNLRPGAQEMFVDHGVVDKDRQRRPSYFVWQEENEPAHLNGVWVFDPNGVPTGFCLTVMRRSETELPSYLLTNYRIEWTLLDQENNVIDHSTKTLQQIGDPQTLTGHWQRHDAKALRLELRLYRPTGFVALKRMLSWSDPARGDFRESAEGSILAPSTSGCSLE